MTSWNADDLTAIGDAEELEISSTRPDGTLRPFVTIWHVALAGGLYVRSAYGPQNGWFRRALGSGAGRISAGGIERDVIFEVPSGIRHEDLDAAYRQKYANQPPEYVAPVVGDIAASATLLVIPA